MSDNERRLPLIIDLDGTLIKNDLTFERLFQSLSGAHFLQILKRIFAGKQHLKIYLEDVSTELDPETLHYNPQVLEVIKAHRELGSPVYLVSGSPQDTVSKIAQFLPEFDGAYGSSSDLNLVGQRKAEFLKGKFPEGFSYVGNSGQDKSVWSVASASYTVDEKYKSRAQYIGKDRRRFSRLNSLRSWGRLMRVKHWIKNLLVLVPLAIDAERLFGPLGPSSIWLGFAAFVLLGFVASSSYIINDAIDLEFDRRNKFKRDRPLASGEISLPKAIFGSVLLSSVAYLLSFLILGLQFGLTLLFYQVLVVGYSLFLKQEFVDVIVLALLFDIRLILGFFATGAAYSFWLLVVSFFSFLSLGFLKRHAELSQAPREPEFTHATTRKGYEGANVSSVFALGVSSALAALTTFAVFIEAKGYESNPLSFAMLVLGAVFFFILWSKSSQVKALQDPVVFVSTNPLGLGLILSLGICFWLVSWAG